jgi:hypothetical protein
MELMIDFTECRVDLTANYGGSDQKRGIIYNGKRYMLKLSDRVPDEKRNSLNSSYTNSAYSEHIGCRILKTMGFEVQNTLLGNITMTSSKGVDRIHPVVACENFIPIKCHLVEFKIIEGALMTSKPPKIPAIEDIYEIMTHENAYFSIEFGKTALKAYWDLFIADALLGNFDRHANNWGYLVNEDTNEISIAPIYDCGSCLYPQLVDEALPDILDSEEQIMLRIKKFPQAALTDEYGRKVSYMAYIDSFANQDCTDALLRVFPKISMNQIEMVIDETEGITDIRKKFYKTMLAKRYEVILQKPYERLTGI